MRERILELFERIRAATPDLLSRRTLGILGYVAFFLVTFVIFAYLTFPWDRLKDYVVQEVERPVGPGGVRSPSGWELDIIDLSPSWLNGVSASGVRIAKRPALESDGPPMEMTLDRVDAHASLLGLIFGRRGGSLRAEFAGGTADLDVAQSGAERQIDLTLDAVELRRVGILRAFVPIPLVGRVSGDVDLVLGAEPTDTSGAVSLVVEGLTAGDGNAKLPVPGMGDGITLERVDAGDLTLAGEIEEGVLDLSTLAADGTDIELAGDGTLRFGKTLPRSMLDLLLYVKIKDAYRDRNDRTRSLFSLIELSPQLRSARTEDGALQFQLGGALGGALRTTPAGSRPRPGG